MGTLKELLATPDAVRITTPPLPRETMERVLEIIRGDVDAEKVQVDNPTQNLESYFLSVVEKAKQNSAETSGATSGARVAAYLRGDGDIKPSTEKILERFTAPTETAEIAKVQVVTPTAAETAATKKLEALTKPTEPVEEEKVITPETTKPADLSKANEKLSSLLGKPKSDS